MINFINSRKMLSVRVRKQFQTTVMGKYVCPAVLQLRVTSYSSSEEDGNSRNKSCDSESEDKLIAPHEQNVKKKLNHLLKMMLKDGPLLQHPTDEKLELAKPERLKKPKMVKILNGRTSSTDYIDHTLIEATKAVAERLGRNMKETESELLQKLQSPKISFNLNDIIDGMVIDHGETVKNRKEVPMKDWNRMRREETLSRQPVRRMKEAGLYSKIPAGVMSRIDLCGGLRLNIFEKEQTSTHKDPPQPTFQVWEKEEAHEMKLLSAHPPRNYFQHMILWTEQRKLWRFPIDNEQEIEEEREVYFAEHVLLDHHLMPWCPKMGPVRHFMELVCVGLSKNPYMSVAEKKDTIDWYAQYFSSKRDILEEVGAIL